MPSTNEDPWDDETTDEEEEMSLRGAVEEKRVLVELIDPSELRDAFVAYLKDPSVSAEEKDNVTPSAVARKFAHMYFLFNSKTAQRSGGVGSSSSRAPSGSSSQQSPALARNTIADLLAGSVIELRTNVGLSTRFYLFANAACQAIKNQSDKQNGEFEWSDRNKKFIKLRGGSGGEDPPATNRDAPSASGTGGKRKKRKTRSGK